MAPVARDPQGRTALGVVALAGALILVTGCATGNRAAPAVESLALRPVFEHIRVDANARLVEFDAQVRLNFLDPYTPDTWLEQLVCTPDSKEHESLVVMLARPSQVHAAMLLIGLEPGTPGRWSWDGQQLITHPPTGSRVRITVVYQDAAGRASEVPITDWVVNADDGRILTDMARPNDDHFVFGGSIEGSRPGRTRYAADAAGTMIGLTSFGTETISWSRVWSPEEALDEPQWLAYNERIPPMDSMVVVRIWADGD